MKDHQLLSGESHTRSSNSPGAEETWGAISTVKFPHVTGTLRMISQRRGARRPRLPEHREDCSRVETLSSTLNFNRFLNLVDTRPKHYAFFSPLLKGEGTRSADLAGSCEEHIKIRG